MQDRPSSAPYLTIGMFLSFIERTSKRIANTEIKAFLGEITEYVSKKVVDHNVQVNRKFPKEELSKNISDLISYIGQKEQELEKINLDPEFRPLSRGAPADLKSALKSYQDELASFKMPEPIRLQPDKLYDQQRKLAEVNDNFVNALTQIKEIAEEKGCTVYISHAATDGNGNVDASNESLLWIVPFLNVLRSHLRAAGIHVHALLDEEDRSGSLFNMTHLENSNFVILIGTEHLLKKHKQRSDRKVMGELNYITRNANSHSGNWLQLILLAGTIQDSFPIEFEFYHAIRDWGKNKTYFQHFCHLIATLYSEYSAKFPPIWEDFLKSIPSGVKSFIAPSDQPFSNAFLTNLPMQVSAKTDHKEAKQDDMSRRLESIEKKQDQLLAFAKQTQDTTVQLSETVKSDTTSILQQVKKSEDHILEKLDNFDSFFKLSEPLIEKQSTEATAKLVEEDVFDGNVKLNRFYNRFKKLLNDFLTIARLIEEKQIAPDQKNVERASSVIEGLANLVPIPSFTNVVKILTGVFKKIDLHSQQTKAEKTTDQLGNRPNIISGLAHLLTHNFQAHIMRLALSEKGIDQFAKSARKRLVNKIGTLNIDDFINKTDDEIIEILLFAIIESKFSVKRKTRVMTENPVQDKEWTPNGILSHSGLELSHNHLKWINKVTKNKYPFHLGSEREKQRFKFDRPPVPPRPARR